MRSPGYEALLRWQHPTEGTIAPLEFIPLAEESGLIVPLGEWVLAEACRYGAALQAELGREVGMAVNVSARQLEHPDFIRHVEQALADSGFPPRCLTLELTESVLLASGDHTEQRLAALKASGISLALDDFGTGTRRSPTCSASRSTSSRSTAASPTRSAPAARTWSC